MPTNACQVQPFSSTPQNEMSFALVIKCINLRLYPCMLWNICRYSRKMTICQALLQALSVKNEISFG